MPCSSTATPSRPSGRSARRARSSAWPTTTCRPRRSRSSRPRPTSPRRRPNTSGPTGISWPRSSSASTPDAFLDEAGADAPKIEPGDLEIIGQKLDFLGLNLYAGDFVRAKADGSAELLPFPEQYPLGDLPWLKVSPQVLYWGVRLASEVFGVKTFYFTENGAAFQDTITPAGEVIDLDRREYIRNHLISIHRALDEGYDVRGYFLWSFLDNWEWAEGFNTRFGIVRTDFQTLARTPKLSARWFSEVVRQNRIV